MKFYFDRLNFKKRYIIIILLLISPFIILNLVANYINTTTLKTKLTAKLENVLDWKITLKPEDLDINVTWRLSPRITAENLILENPNFLQKSDQIKVQRINIELNLVKLLFKTITVNKLEILNPEILITKPKNKNKSSSYVLPNDTFPINELRKLNVEIPILIQNLRFKSQLINKISGIFTIKDEQVNFKSTTYIPGGKIETKILYNIQPIVPEFNLISSAKDIELTNEISANLKFQAELNSTGDNIRSLVKKLNGQILAEVGSGVISGDIKLLSGNIISSLSKAIMPLKDGLNETVFQCAIVNFKIKNGIANTKKGIAIETGTVNIVGIGEINLNNGKIKLAIDPQPKENFDLINFSVAELVLISGTIIDPAVTVNPKGLLKQGGFLASAYATAGLSLLGKGLLKQKSIDPTPCKTALEM